jgi:aspartate/methionine/tyrosine aminotransferase
MSRLAMQVDAVNLGQGFPEGLEPKEVVEAAMRALRDGPHQYPPMLGLPALRQAVAANAHRFLGLEVDWEREVLVTSGATEALADAFFGLLNSGDEVILIEPAYDSYPVIIRRAGAVPVPVRLRPAKWELPRDEFKAAITPRTKAIVINTPMNPIGKIFGDDDLRFVADLLLKHDLVAIADEVYEHLVFDGRRHKSLFALPEVRDRVVRIGSAGKTFSVTGWKVGYVTADARLIAPIARAHQFVTFTTPPALQSAAAFGLRLPDSYFVGLKAALRERRDFLVDGLRGIGFDVGDVGATYFAVAGASRFDKAGDDGEFCRRLTLEAGVTAVPISAFYGERDVRSHIRFCFAKKRETLEAALERLARWSERAGLRAAS